MACHEYTKVWQMAPGQLMQLDGARGTTLQVTRGTLWVTLERDLRDVVIDAGTSFTIDKGGVTLVEAQDHAVVCVFGHHGNEVRVGAPRPTLSSRIANGMRRALASAMRARRFVPYY